MMLWELLFLGRLRSSKPSETWRFRTFLRRRQLIETAPVFTRLFVPSTPNGCSLILGTDLLCLKTLQQDFEIL